MQIGEARRLVDFWVDFDGRQEFVLLSDSVSEIPHASPLEGEPNAASIRPVTSTDLAAAHIWIDNWRHMLPCLVASRGLVPSSLQRAVETFVTVPHTLLEIEREFTVGDPVLVRAAVFGLLHAGHISAVDLRTEPLSLLTRFTSIGAA
ncbi:hypothetical protein [Burkholderia sp. Ac-20392]|uniref:hypothetical protein n=1 Tax=Burkholderia TaxID=32008 RepID=UPI0014543733|nr:hypothetical protein BLA6860_05723 [Burkholderia lata]